LAFCRNSTALPTSAIVEAGSNCTPVYVPVPSSMIKANDLPLKAKAKAKAKDLIVKMMAEDTR